DPIEHHHADGKRLEDLSQESLTASDLRFAAHAVRDVHRYADDAGHVPGRIAEWLELEPRGRRAVVDLQHARLPRERPPTSLQHALAVGRLGEQLRDRLSHRRGAGREPGARVPDDAQVAIGDACAGGYLLGEEAQPGLGLLELADVDHGADGATGLS